MPAPVSSSLSAFTQIPTVPRRAAVTSTPGAFSTAICSSLPLARAPSTKHRLGSAFVRRTFVCSKQQSLFARPALLPSPRAAFDQAADAAAAAAGASGGGVDSSTVILIALAIAVVVYDNIKNPGGRKKKSAAAKAAAEAAAESAVPAGPVGVDPIEFWEYAVSTYNTVGKELIRLQLRHAASTFVDPNALLFCAWSARVGYGALTPAEVEAAVAWGESVKAWKEGLARQGEREAEAETEEGMAADAAAVERVLDSEGDDFGLDDEEPLPPAPATPPRPSRLEVPAGPRGAIPAVDETRACGIARDNIQKYFGAIEEPLSGTDAALLGRVLAACFPAAQGDACTALEVTGDPSTYEEDAMDEFEVTEYIERELRTVVPDVDLKALFSEAELDALVQSTRMAVDTTVQDILKEGGVAGLPTPAANGNCSGNGAAKGKQPPASKEAAKKIDAEIDAFLKDDSIYGEDEGEGEGEGEGKGGKK